YWSQYAMKEAQIFGKTNIVTDSSPNDYCDIQPFTDWTLNKNLVPRRILV
ncbi:phosphoserine aminotransferase, putative, partial [Eimeria maxima]